MRHRATATILAGLLAAAIAIPTASAQPAPGQSMFGRMLPAQTTTATDQQLADLAQLMSDPNADADNNPAGLMSGFTYFGQFVDHDLTLDTSPSPVDTVDPATLANGRRFSFDLDSVYGGGPGVSPQLYQADRKHFVVNPNVFDLPRNPDGSALLVEARNDENQIIAQIHASFLAFHNRMVDRTRSYLLARLATVAAYRWIVRNEFLPEIVSAQAIADVQAQRRVSGAAGGFYNPGSRANPMTPVEFSVAAYRFGHSQVRRAYRLNGNGNCANLQVFSLTNPAASLMGGRPIADDRRISWGQFLDALPQPAECAALVAPPPASSRNVSRKIDHLISTSLFQLPIPGAAAAGSNVLAFRNMVRWKHYQMPTGQTAAQAMGIPVADTSTLPAPFDTDTPLWFYILLESGQATNGETLGPVGGRIVAEVFLDVLGRFSFSPPAGQPNTFGLDDFLVLAGVASRTTP